MQSKTTEKIKAFFGRVFYIVRGQMNLFCLKVSESSVSELIGDVYSNQIQGWKKKVFW